MRSASVAGPWHRVLRTPPDLWSEAIAQAADGWLGGPRDISASGDIDVFGKGETNIASRLGVCQFGKLRARDDLRRNMVNLATSILTPLRSHRGAILRSCLRTSMDPAFLGFPGNATTRKPIRSFLYPMGSRIWRPSPSDSPPPENGRASFLRPFSSDPCLLLPTTTSPAHSLGQPDFWHSSP